MEAKVVASTAGYEEEKKPLAENGLQIKGVHLDVCRHFIPCKMILELIDLMAKLNLNTLHLHLSDDQAIPFESAKYPQLKAAASPGRILSIVDQEKIAECCKKNGIEIIAELDIPGHSVAFLHAFYKTVPPEKRLGIITKTYIDMDRDLPIIFDLFEELANRFNSKYIHMGGDEAEGFTAFPSLVLKVCQWANERKLKVIAWDEVASYFKEMDGKPPSNLIIQRWRRKAGTDCHMAPCILSQGYYLDHVDDPIVYYKRSPKSLGANIGCIACIWTELIDENNFWYSILPTLYLLALRWNEFPNIQKHVPIVLKKLCEKYGYPESPFDDTWKRRMWVSFYKDHVRSTTSVTVDMKLDREHDQYPVFSKKLIWVQYILYKHCVMREKVDEEELSQAIDFTCEATGDNVSFLQNLEKGWEKELKKVIAGTDYKLGTCYNGIVDVLQRLIEK